jgi:hypothetical protein
MVMKYRNERERLQHAFTHARNLQTKEKKRRKKKMVQRRAGHLPIPKTEKAAVA